MLGNNYLEELWIGIKADYSSLQQGLKLSQDEIKSFIGHISSSSAQLKKFGASTTVVSGAVSAMGIAINQVFAKFEQSMANTVSVLGGGEEQMNQLGDTARRMGESTIFSASQAADAMYYLASAGYNANQIMGSLKGTLDLAAATQYDLAETTRIVVSALNAYGMEAGEATRVSNLFSAIISASQATMDRIGDSMKYVAPIAAQLGISIEQTTAALGLMYNSGLEASQAGTYLRQGLIRLQAPTKDAMEAIKDLGLSYDDINPQFNSLVDIMSAFEKAGAGMIDKGDELAKIFDSRAVSGWQILIRSGADALQGLEEKITGTNKSAEMAEIQVNTFSGSVKLMKSAMEEAAIQIGEALQPVLRTLVDYIRDAFALFNSLPKSIKTVSVTVIALATGLGLVVGPVALLLAQLPTLITMFSALGVSMSVALGWVGAISIAIIALTSAIGGYVRKQAEMKTKVNEVVESTGKELSSFDLLTRRYLELRGIVNKTASEKAMYLKVIKEIQEKYPNYFKNIDLEKSKLEDVKIAIDNAKDSLLEYLNLKIAQAEFEEESEKYIEIGKKINENQEKLTDANIKLTDAQKQWNDETARTIKLGNDIEFLVPTLEGLWNQFTGKGGAKAVADANNEVNNLTSSLSSLEAEQNAIYERIKRKQDDVEKRLGTTVTPKPSGSKVDGTITDCPDGYKWDDSKGMCVPIETDPTGDAKEKEKQLQSAIMDIKKRSLQAQLDLLTQNKDKSLAEDEKYLSAKHLLERTELKNWYELEKQKLIELGASKEQMTLLEETYADEINKISEKQLEENKAMRKKWSDEDRKMLENKLNYESQYYSVGLENLKKYLQQRLETLIGEGKRWNDEYLNILNQLDSIDEQIQKPKENKMIYELEYVKNQDMMDGGTGYTEDYGIKLEEYQQHLLDKLLATQEWSDEYKNILTELDNVQQEMYRNQLEQARFLFFSIQDAANVANAGISGGFNRMWSMYIIPKSREAKNEMDAIWMAIRDSALRAIQQIVQDYITQQLVKLISKVVGFAVGGGAGAALAGATVGGFGEASGVGSSFDSSGYAATGAVVKKSGTLKVHQDEVIVPANIVRANKKQYEGAITEINNGIQPSNNVSNNINLVLNNPIVNDNRYWDTVIEENINPAIDRINKRMS